jgi:hypothetical protein
MIKLIEDIPVMMVVLVCLTIGLAPFNPPHILQKLQLLVHGQLVKPIDWFDLLLHGFPWVLLILKVGLLFKR